MRSFPRLAGIAACLALALPGLSPAPGYAQENAYQRWVRALDEAEPDPGAAFALDGLTLRRDAATLTFGSGILQLLPPVDGRVYGAVFRGRGHLSLSAPNPVERDQIRRSYGADSVDLSFSRAVLLFTDGTGDELVAAGEPAPGGAVRDGRDEVREALRYVSDDDWVRSDVMVPLLNGGPGWFYAHVAEDRDEPTMFEVDPYAAEEIGLYRRGDRHTRKIVARFHQERDYASGRSLPQEALDLVAVTRYEIETDIEGNLELQGRATAHVVPRTGNHPWVPFQLHPDLELDSIVGGNGSRVSAHRPDDRATLWLDLTELPMEGDDLTFFYHGRVMNRIRDFWVVMETYRTWYPVYAFDRPIPYRLVFHVPDEYSVATVGALVEERHDEERDRTTFVFEAPPVRLVAFNMGDFESFTLDEGGPVPPITVQLSERAHRALADVAFDANVFIPQQGDMAGAVAHDLARSYEFFRDVFGPVPADRFLATEIPSGHGEAYPGLTLLSWSTFQYTSEKGFDEMFRAHEMAHQWWGIGVRPATPRDRWLAEGFSEFAGLWYAARARGSVGLYHDRLEETREALLDSRGEADPIALGTRVDAEDYQDVIYHKGAWVLHMLRVLLTDPDTGDDSVFADLMRTFYRDNLGTSVGTAHFQAAVQAAVGADMAWFFDQWVRGSDIPTYRFAHVYEDLPDGSVKARVRIRQEEVPDDFRMIVPILLDFGEEGTAVVRVDVQGPVTEAELPILPRRPDGIQLNPYESVLAEVETEDWR